MGDIGEVARRLAEIHRDLSDPDVDPTTRYDLLLERDRFKGEAAQLAEAAESGRARSDLEAELQALKKARTQILSDRTGYASGKGGNNSGPASGAWVKLSKAALSASGLGRINVRISALEDLLAARRDE